MRIFVCSIFANSDRLTKYKKIIHHKNVNTQ